MVDEGASRGWVTPVTHTAMGQIDTPGAACLKSAMAAQTKHETYRVNVVAYEDEGLWHTQCVEYDIAAFADSLPKALKAFRRSFIANLVINRDLGRDGLDKIPPPPPRLQEMFKQHGLPFKPMERAVPPLEIDSLRILEAA